MTDFLTQIASQQIESAPVTRPLIAPMFSPGQPVVKDLPETSLLDEQRIRNKDKKETRQIVPVRISRKDIRKKSLLYRIPRGLRKIFISENQAGRMPRRKK